MEVQWRRVLFISETEIESPPCGQGALERNLWSREGALSSRAHSHSSRQHSPGGRTQSPSCSGGEISKEGAPY